MSLIEEALRRVKDPLLQKGLHTPPQTAPQAAPPQAHSWPTAQHQAQPAPSPRVAVVIAVVTITAAALAILGTVWLIWRATSGRSAAHSTGIPSWASTQPQTSAAHGPTVSGVQVEEFALTGIVEGLGESYAVINGVVVRVGEQINRATVLDIADGTVTLRREDGTDVVLRVPR